MTVDIDNTPLQRGDVVICIKSSIIIAPYCTHPFKRPTLISSKKRKNVEVSESDTTDDILIKNYNSSMRDARLVRDEIVGKETIVSLNKGKSKVTMQWYKIKEVSGDHISFYPTSDTDRTRHFHPACKFKKVIKNNK